MVALGIRILALSLFLIQPCCGAPEPRAPAEIRRAAKAPRPSWVERLELSEEKADEATDIWADVSRHLVPYNKARLELLDETIVEVKAGQLDREKLLPLGEETIAQFDLALPHFIEGLNRLHRLLSPEERKKLVGLVTARTGTEEEERTAKQDRLAKVLDLTAGQKTRLYPKWLGLFIGNLGLLNSLKRDVKEAGEQFVSESFDANTLSLVRNRRPMDLLEFYFDGLNATLPTLTEKQRLTLAAYLDTRVR